MFLNVFVDASVSANLSRCQVSEAIRCFSLVAVCVVCSWHRCLLRICIWLSPMCQMQLHHPHHRNCKKRLQDFARETNQLLAKIHPRERLSGCKRSREEITLPFPSLQPSTPTCEAASVDITRFLYDLILSNGPILRRG